MLITMLTDEGRKDDCQGAMLSADAARMTETLARDEVPEYRELREAGGKVAPKADQARLERLGVPKGYTVTPIIELLYEAGDPANVRTVRLYCGMSERGATRLLESWITVAKMWSSTKRKERKAVGRLFPWKLPKDRAGDRIQLIGGVPSQGDLRATDLEAVLWFPGPGLEKDEVAENTGAVYRALQMLAVASTGSGLSH